MARVGPEAYPDALRQRHVREMDFTGKPMKGYVFVEPAGFELDSALEKLSPYRLNNFQLSGAGRGTRTPTLSPTPDFESGASTNSAIPA